MVVSPPCSRKKSPRLSREWAEQVLFSTREEAIMTATRRVGSTFFSLLGSIESREMIMSRAVHGSVKKNHGGSAVFRHVCFKAEIRIHN